MKVALVTGSAKGLGASIVQALAKNGFTVVINYRNSEKDAQSLLEQIKKDSPQSIAFQADVLNETEVESMAQELETKLGRIDLLVNNVGNFLYKPFSQTSNEEFRDMLESNIYSTLYCSRAFLPLMRSQKSGNIINIGAVGCERLVIRENSTPYFLGKTGVYVLTKALAHEEAAHGIRVNMISPGSMATDIFKPADFPAGRAATHEDVVGALRFLISPQGSYINGANLEVSGGFIPGF